MAEPVPALAELIDRTGDVLGGMPVFRGTCVPVRALFDYLAASYRVDEFLEDFPTVTREQALGVLENLTATLLVQLRPKKRGSRRQTVGTVGR